MKLVLYSPNFLPLTGGLENMVLELAQAFYTAGHEVTVLTSTLSIEPDPYPFAVLRCARWGQQVTAMRRSDLVLQFNVSLKGILPWLLSDRPLVVSHQTTNTADWRGHLKAWVANHLAVLNIGCSGFMTRQFRRAITIPNAYREDLFILPDTPHSRNGDLIFVGRLVSDKGVNVLLDALALLRTAGLTPKLTIVGDGPEEPLLRAQVSALELSAQVQFAGKRTGQALADTLQAHQILVVPSLWNEPFGIVALEGAACGCLVIGSAGGGLPEAIGPAGLTFPNADAAALADCLRRALQTPDAIRPAAETLQQHLQQHRRAVVAQQYLDALKAVLPSSTKA